MVDGLEKNLIEKGEGKKAVGDAVRRGPPSPRGYGGRGRGLFRKKTRVKEEGTTKMEERKEKSARRGGRKVWMGIGGGVLLLLVLMGWFVARPVWGMYKVGVKLVAAGEKMQQAAGGQNLEEMRVALAEVKGQLVEMEGAVGKLRWARGLPWVGGYQTDAAHAVAGAKAGVEAGEIVIDTVAPYADIVGLSGGQEATSGAETAEDRIGFVVETIAQVQPQLAQIGEKMKQAEEEISQIDPSRYPETVKGKPVRQRVEQMKSLVGEAATLTNDARPLLELAPYFLGVDGERTYLVLFQNDKELRPTGGFITAYSIMKVKKGEVKPVLSDDIYALDEKFKSRIPAPEPILKYLPKVPYWYMRDMNLSPDFRVSMEEFMKAYEKTGSSKVDGVIAVDTHLLLNLLEVLGPVGVSGYGTFSAEVQPVCNCPQVIYELESFADKATPFIRDDRKAILGPLMNSVLANALGSPKEKLPALFEVGMTALQEKHVLFYFPESGAQEAVEAFGIAGRIKPSDGDYLAIVDTNFAGAKSNLYVEQQVEQEVKISGDGTVTKTVTINYKNPQKHDGWLNGEYRDWFRVYVPKGSELVDSSGSEVEVETGEDLGKTVFSGFFTMRPLGVTKLVLTYKLPFRVEGEYRLLIQKQGGIGEPFYTVKVGKKTEEFNLEKDKELGFSL